MFRRGRNANKAKLEHKLYLARESPEPVFDLSECELVAVPAGIYSLCRVFLKESLRLERNRLTSLDGGGDLRDLRLLRILDVSDNRFRRLPDEIRYLTNLQELYIANNRLERLTDGVCELKALRVLDVSDNGLAELPERAGEMRGLHALTATGNRLTRLPTSCHRWTGLKELRVDVDRFEYPPTEVVADGALAAVRFICDDLGVAYDRVDETDRAETTHGRRRDSTDSLQGRLRELDDVKLQRVREFLEIERVNELSQRQELEVAEASRLDRQKLLLELTERQTEFDVELGRIQRRKDSERTELIERLQEAESAADASIRQLLATGREPHSQLLEQERLEEEEERLLQEAEQRETLRKDEILAAMRKLLEEEADRFRRMDRDRNESNRTLLERQLEDDSTLAEALRSREHRKRDLIERLNSDDDLQRAAVAALLERGDARSWGLLQQIKLVESQLVALTDIELDKRKLRVDQQTTDLCDRRVDLSALLVELLDRQRERRSQLVSTLEAIEERNGSDAEDFWLRQYQRLLNRLPEGLAQAQRTIDVELSRALLANGVIHCLPFLARILLSNVRDVDDCDLSRVGIASPEERRRVLEALRCYEKMSRNEGEVGVPSAPPLENEGGEEEEASAPLPENFRRISTVECVVCMDYECQIIFVPCGHFCSCRACALPLSECPMCRSGIERKITLAS